eukprot:PhF_6_TR20843/c0_g1_i1/m.30019
MESVLCSNLTTKTKASAFGFLLLSALVIIVVPSSSFSSSSSSSSPLSSLSLSFLSSKTSKATLSNEKGMTAKVRLRLSWSRYPACCMAVETHTGPVGVGILPIPADATGNDVRSTVFDDQQHIEEQTLVSYPVAVPDTSDAATVPVSLETVLPSGGCYLYVIRWRKAMYHRLMMVMDDTEKKMKTGPRGEHKLDYYRTFCVESGGVADLVMEVHWFAERRLPRREVKGWYSRKAIIQKPQK